MTASANFKARQVAFWTCTPTEPAEDAGKVCLMHSSADAAYMTPENARHLAADLLAAADQAEVNAAKKQGA